MAIIGILMILSGFLSCGSNSETAVSVSIGTTTSEVNSLILIAIDQGYFNNNGLNMEHEIYSSGVAALDGMFNGEIDMATGSEFAFAGDVLSGKNVTAIAAISRSSIEYLVGRVDRGINTLADLKGKTVGVPLGSRPEFALDRFLYFSGIETSEVNLVNVPVNLSVKALVGGQVDAVAAWQPYIDRIKEQMGDEVVTWDVQEDQPSYTLLMCSEEYTAANPDTIVRFLKSLVQAENFIKDNPEDTGLIIRERLNYDNEYMESIWPDYRFSVTLDQTLVVAMEDQARWIISKNSMDGKQTPNFINHLYIEALEKVKPEAVNIIH
jgi:NitT/TauT family transport system substrate-binding protein